ncbi:uncharacterized protein LOC132947928 [Metopolophium dirhodum]|uniref:uncharacterized protein LOC132947928 n=1 Tax=Metopolophium dirhodum TaxID=44670 RepID=UPI00298F6BF8|nr:uncharacterized protein LOC132947928 [Metopolophium dirhodum]
MSGLWTYCTEDDERTFSADYRTRTPGGHRATPARGFSSGRNDGARCTTTSGRTKPAVFWRGGCSGARRRFLWHAAAAVALHGTKHRTSLEISLCRRTTTTKMLPAFEKPARVFVLGSGRRSAGRFGLKSFRLQIEVRPVRAGTGDGD